jgi:branched-chain amino acid transport system substrate-binding protein
VDRNRRTSAYAAIVATAAIVFGACSSSPGASSGGGGTTAPSAGGGSAPASAAGGGSGTFVLGVDGPITGPAAEDGRQLTSAIKLAFDQIGDKVGNYDIKLVMIDDKADPAQGAANLNQAIVSQGVQAVIGNWNTAVSLAQMDVVAQAKIPFYFSGGSASAIDTKVKSDPQKYSYWLGKQFPPGIQTAPEVGEMFDYYYKQKPDLFPNGKTVAMMAEDTDYGRENINAVGGKLKELGWTVASEDFFPIDDTNQTTTLQKIKGQNVSLLYSIGTSVPSMAAIVNQAHEIGLDVVIMAQGIGYNEAATKLTGNNINGVIDSGLALSSPAALKFVEDYKKAFGFSPVASSAGTAYDYAKFLIKVMNRAIEKYGALTSDSLYKVGVEEVKTGQLTSDEGVVYHTLKFTPETWPAPVVGQGFYENSDLQYQNGKAEVIWPQFAKTADMIK